MSRRNSREAKAARRAEREARAQRRAVSQSEQERPAMPPQPQPDIPLVRDLQTMVDRAEGTAADMRRLTALLTAYPRGPVSDILAAMPPEDAREATALIRKLDAAGFPVPTLENWQEQ